MKSTIKVFQVLETLCEGKAAGVTELSNQLGIKPSSMHRFLAVLTKLGYVQKNADSGKYFATLKIFQLGVSVRNKLSLISIARPNMEELGEMLKETVNIAVFSQNSAVLIDRVQSPATLPTNIIVGQHLPAYCTAFGKIFLAAMSTKELNRYLKTVTLKPLTAQTITRNQALREELRKISKDGFAIDNRELDDNIRCLSSPIRDETALRETYSAMVRKVEAFDPAAQLAGVLLQEMIPLDGVETIIGILADSDFDPAVVFDLGGIFVELLKDSTLQLSPVNREEARRMIVELKGYRLLDGFRGEPRTDIDALVTAIVQVGQLAQNFSGLIAALDINPLIVLPAGQGVVAADILIEMSPAAHPANKF